MDRRTKYYEDRTRLESVRLTTEILTNGEFITDALDRLIGVKLDEYLIFNSIDNEYLTEKDQEKITRDIIVNILEEMGSGIKSQLECYVNPEHTEDFIARRVMIIVSAFCSEYNHEVKDEMDDASFKKYENELNRILRDQF